MTDIDEVGLKAAIVAWNKPLVECNYHNLGEQAELAVRDIITAYLSARATPAVGCIKCSHVFDGHYPHCQYYTPKPEPAVGDDETSESVIKAMVRFTLKRCEVDGIKDVATELMDALRPYLAPKPQQDSIGSPVKYTDGSYSREYEQQDGGLVEKCAEGIAAIARNNPSLYCILGCDDSTTKRTTEWLARVVLDAAQQHTAEQSVMGDDGGLVATQLGNKISRVNTKPSPVSSPATSEQAHTVQPVELIKRLEEQRDHHYRLEEKCQLITGDTPHCSMSYLEAAKGNAIAECLLIIREYGLPKRESGEAYKQAWENLFVGGFIEAGTREHSEWANELDFRLAQGRAMITHIEDGEPQ